MTLFGSLRRSGAAAAPSGSPTPLRSARRTRRALGASAAIALVAALSACTGGGDAAGGGSGDGAQELSIGLTAGPQSLDPAKDIAGVQSQFRTLTNQSLFHMQPDYTAEPVLVDDYEYVGDGNTVFRFTLKPDIQFTDGEPLNAQAVKGWLEYFATANGPFASILQIASIDTPDDLTVQLNLAAPNPLVPLFLSEYGNRGFVSSPAAVANPDLLASGTYGVGPYVMDQDASTVGDTYVLKPSDTYFDQSAIRFSSVNVKVIASSQSILQALSAGQIDFANLDPTVAPAAEGAGLTVVRTPGNTLNVTLLDRAGTKTPALGDPRVRQALNYAVNRDPITQAVSGEFGTSTSQFRTDHPVDGLNDAYPYDADEARSLLAQAGYPDGFTLDVVAPTNAILPGAEQAMQAIAQDWEAIGVTVNVTQAGPDLISQVLSTNYGAFLWSPDANPTYLTHSLLYGPQATLNPFQADNPDLDAVFAQAAVAPVDQADDLWEQYNTIVSEQALNVPIFGSDSLYAVSSSLTGFDESTPWLSNLAPAN